MEKIKEYYSENTNVKTQSMVTSINLCKEDTNTLMVKRLLFKNYRLLYYLVIDNWTDEEIMNMYVNTIKTINYQIECVISKLFYLLMLIFQIEY